MTGFFSSTCTIAAGLAVIAAHPSYVYKFEAANAAGVDGSIRIKYASANSSIATITTSLDFSAVDQAKIAAFDGNCTKDVTSWKLHIHTKWSSNLTSDSFKQCSKAATDNHYDPLRACGPASEYIAEPDCKAKSKSYTCNPGNYTANPLACEKGDLVGKFGAFDVSKNPVVTASWTDEHFPLPSEHTNTWSMVLHATCGKEAPRISCAVATKSKDEAGHGKSTPSQSPSTGGCGVRGSGH